MRSKQFVSLVQWPDFSGELDSATRAVAEHLATDSTTPFSKLLDMTTSIKELEISMIPANPSEESPSLAIKSIEFCAEPEEPKGMRLWKC